MNVKILHKQIKNLYPKTSLFLSTIENGFYLNKIKIPNSLKNKGVGTKIMQCLCEFADKEHCIIKLFPSSLYGSELDRLINFYNRFGFYFEDDEIMIRKPL